MSQKEQILEMRGIQKIYLEKYFMGIGGIYDGESKFSGPEWEVELGNEGYCSLGLIRLLTIDVTFRAEEELLSEMIRNFNRNFMRAGG